MNALLKPVVKALKWQDKKLTSVSMRAMQWTGRSDKPIHPKHLYDDGRNAHLHDLFRAGQVFLDVGSGSGSDCLSALQKGAAHVYGIERISSSIEISKARLDDFKGKFDIFDLDLEDAKIPLPDASIDLINFSNVLEHIVNRQPLLKELQRILKPDGIMHISIPNADTPWKKLQRKVGLDSRDDPDHKIEYTKEGLGKEMAEAGLKIVTPLHVIVPSLPVHGILSLSAIISKDLYKKSQAWKTAYVQKHPEDTVGWAFLVQRL